MTSDLVLLVLACVREAGDDSGDPDRRGYLTSVDHDEQFHQVIIDLPGPTLDDVDILSADRLTNLNAACVK